MEKYNYDFIADQEPDGNSEWYPAKKVDEGMERLKKENGNLSDECIRYTAEIERLREAVEKYGIHLEYCDFYGNYEDDLEPRICTCGLQQALKDE